MPTHQIHMTHGNPATNRITLPGGDLVWVRRGDEISWDRIGSNIEAFCIQGKNPASNIFTQPIPTNLSPSLTLRVDLHAPLRPWGYSIFWRQAGDPPTARRPHDPVIAVRPHTVVPFSVILILITTTLLSLFAISLFTKKRKKRHQHKKRKAGDITP